MAQQRELAVKFKVLKFLGKGSYGSVFQVQRLSDGQMYALKEMDVRAMSQAEREDSVNEIRLLASVSHVNVIAYHEAFLDGNRLCIIMEYAPDGDLAKIIKKHSAMKRPIPEDLVWKYFIQVVLGLQALHNMKILHRDIKPGNIMIMDSGVAKIGDLGISKLLTKTMAAKTQIGTPHYMPPEIWRNRPYGFSSDTWALGCLLYEMLTLSVPFEARSMSELRYKVLKGTYPPIPSSLSRELANIVRECLDPNADRRPGMDRILQMPAVASRLGSLPSDIVRKPPSTASSVLINTIKVPRNFQMIKSKLPPAQYVSNMGIGTIDEGYEDDNTQPPAQVAKLPPAYVSPPAFRPAKQPPAVQQAAKLPAIAHATPPHPQPPPPPYVNRNKPPAAPPPLQTPAYSLADEKPWYVNNSRVSESHANYGAFYRSVYPTPTGAAQAAYSVDDGGQQQQQQPSKHQLLQQIYQQQQQAMLSPYMQKKQQQYNQQRDFYAGGPQYAAAAQAQGARAGAGDVQLPSINGRGGGNGGAAGGGGGGGGNGGGAGSKLPPWNYGNAYKGRPANGPPRAGAGYAGAGVAGEYVPTAASGAQVARYPPPQWAPQPTRW